MTGLEPATSTVAWLRATSCATSALRGTMPPGAFWRDRTAEPPSYQDGALPTRLSYEGVIVAGRGVVSSAGSEPALAEHLGLVPLPLGC